MELVSLLSFAFIFNYALAGVEIRVHPSDISMSLHEQKNFSVYLTNPINDTIHINFKYQPSGIVEKFTPNRTIDFGDVGPLTYVIKPNKASKGTISVKVKEDIDTTNAFIRLKINKLDVLDVISTVIGWLYFVAWSISFYPQVYLNWKRKSVTGLDFNFLTLNIVGFFCYSVFNIVMYTSPVVQKQYFKVHEYGINPVHVNDIVFAVHAFVISVFTGIQCLIYERGNQKVSVITKVIHVGILLFLGISLILSLTNAITYLLFMDFFSYVKLGITIIKYIPQAAFNFIRKSTVGWSIGNILLDFTGGTLSMLQMFIDAYNYNSWGIIFGDLTKFGLGLFSVLFDILFIVQHYCLFRQRSNFDDYENMSSDDNKEEDRTAAKTQHTEDPSSDKKGLI